MGLFEKIFRAFARNQPHPLLSEDYSLLNELAAELMIELKRLKSLQLELISSGREGREAKGESTGKLGLEKTLFIDEELLKKMERLAGDTEKRFLQSTDKIKLSEPLSPAEKEQLLKVIEFLKEVRMKIPAWERLSSLRLGVKDKLVLVETALRDITTFSKQYYLLEKAEKRLIRKIREKEIIPLFKNIYLSPLRLPADPTILVYPVTKKQLRLLEKETNKINSCQDSNYKIEWRRWWRKMQLPEKDFGTPLKDPHINVSIKLFGEEKKDIHLLMKAA